MAVKMKGYNRPEDVNAGVHNGPGIGGNPNYDTRPGFLNDSKDSNALNPKELTKEDFLSMMKVEEGE